MSSSQDISSKRRRVEEQDEESAEPLMCIFVRMMNGDVLTLHGNRGSPINTLMNVVSFENMSLFYLGKELELGQTIERYEIHPESTIDAIEKKYKEKYMAVWATLEKIVTGAYTMCANQLCDCEMVSWMEYFTDSVEMDDESLSLQHFNTFRSLSVTEALCNLYSSPIETASKTGNELIVIFTFGLKTELSETRPSLSACYVSSILQLCACLKNTCGPTDLLYQSCRNHFCSFVPIIYRGGSAAQEVGRRLITLTDILPLVIELGNQITPMTNHEEVNRYVREDAPSFSSVLITALFLIGENRKQFNILERSDPFYIQYLSLKSLFHNICYSVNYILRKAESWKGVALDSVISNAPGYLSLLKTAHLFSNFFWDDNKIRVSVASILENRKKILNILVKKFPFQGQTAADQSYWLVYHKKHLDFESRRHLAMAQFSWKFEGLGTFEMLMDRSDFFLTSIEYITNANPEELRTGLDLEFSNEEAVGVGVLREWFQLVFKDIFSDKAFICNSSDLRRFYLNPDSDSNAKLVHSSFFIFCGRVIALALIHGVQVGKVLDHVLFLQLAGLDIHLEDIIYTDNTTYTSLTIMKNSTDLGVFREVFEGHFPDAEDIEVNSNNIDEYVDKYIRHRFHESTSSKATEIAKGFEDIMPSKECMKHFFSFITSDDLAQMLGGSYDISAEDWKLHTKCNGYNAGDDQIKWFWEIVKNMSQDKRRKLLNFWTAIEYLPSEGFSELPPLAITKADCTIDHLPTSQTCFYTIRFPAYKTKEMMTQRIEAILQLDVAFGIK